MNSNSNRSLESVIQNGYNVNLGDYIGQGWQLVSQNLGGFIGFTVLLILINLILALIPLGGIITMVIGAPLNAGFFLVAFKQLRSQDTTFSDFFRGFNTFSPLFITALISGAILFVASIPAIGAGFGFLWPLFATLVAAQGNETQPSSEEIQAILSQMNPTLLLLAVLLYLPVIYLAISYTLWVPFVLDRKMQPWQALEASRRLITKNWFGFFFLLLVLGILNFLGALLCGLGIFFTLPLTFCTLAVAYKEIMGLSMPSATTESGF